MWQVCSRDGNAKRADRDHSTDRQPAEREPPPTQPDRKRDGEGSDDRPNLGTRPSHSQRDTQVSDNEVRHQRVRSDDEDVSRDSEGERAQNDDRAGRGQRGYRCGQTQLGSGCQDHRVSRGNCENVPSREPGRCTVEPHCGREKASDGGCGAHQDEMIDQRRETEPSELDEERNPLYT